MSDIQVLVIHHRSPKTLDKTVGRLIETGLAAESILVVDNSEAPTIINHLRAVLPGGVELLSVPNAGYGAAVNRGLEHIREKGGIESLLVCTHEVLPRETFGLRALADALHRVADLAAVAPVLELSSLPGEVWSSGGYLTRYFRIPRHAESVPSHGSVTDRDWLDGSIIMYRWNALKDFRFDERYFMYVEEVDLHQQLREHGWRVATLATIRATQDTRGTPAYFAARNSFLFQRKWGRTPWRMFTPHYLAARAAVRALAHGNLDDLGELARGWLDGWAGRYYRPTRALSDSSEQDFGRT